ncbi:MAG: urease accessory protein UreD [Pseudomonadota bacterium]
MPDAPIVHQRMRGAAMVSMQSQEGKTKLSRLAQSGAAKAMLPRVHGGAPEIVFLNTAGGLTGGDRLSYHLEIGPNARVVATTQAAERAYSSLEGTAPAELDVNICVSENAELAWLPQETIVFEAASLTRKTKIDLASTARCLTCETIVLGRAAMGETLSKLRFRDVRSVHRDGAPVMIEPLMLNDGDLRHAKDPARFGPARAIASVILVAADAETRLEPLRRLLDSVAYGVEAAASAWDGRLVMRALAGDAFPLRRTVSAVLEYLSGAALPRVWQM